MLTLVLASSILTLPCTTNGEGARASFICCRWGYVKAVGIWENFGGSISTDIGDVSFLSSASTPLPYFHSLDTPEQNWNFSLGNSNSKVQASWHTVLFSHGLNRCQKSTSGFIYARKKSNWQTESAAAATVHNQITTEKKRSELLSIPTYVSDCSSNCSALVRFELWWSYLKSPSVQLRLKTSNTYTTYIERKKKNTTPWQGSVGHWLCSTDL